MMREAGQIVLKGIAMGAANVIPGVSGGTVAFITGIYERLIEALKAFGPTSFPLLAQGRIPEFARRVDLAFLGFLGAGVAIGILTLAKALKWGFAHHAVLVWSFFFGLIAASIPFVARMVRRWDAGAVACLTLGAILAVSMLFLGRAEENTSFFYLCLCGVVAVCSMILPGLSGSFVLLLMGNYELIMIDTVNQLRSEPLQAMRVLLPVGLGAVVGLAGFARLLSWLFAKHHDIAVATITGFIGGSLAIIWPWKDVVIETFEHSGEVKEKVTGYGNWRLPEWSDPGTWGAMGVMALGVVLVIVMEVAGRSKPISPTSSSARS